MSVIVKGMEMPTSCYDCPVECEGDICGTCETLNGVPFGYSPKPENVRPITKEVRLVHGVVDMATGTLVYKTAKTNADRIRNMTDEELADWLIMNGDGSDYATWLEWLKQETD